MDYSVICLATIMSLNERQFSAHYVDKKEDVVPFLSKLIPQGSTVATGGSLTLKETGVIDFIENGDFTYYKVDHDSPKEIQKEMTLKRFSADAFLLSANAVTLDGKIFQEDGASTRVAPMIYGPEKVYIVIGINKIVENDQAAIDRIKKVAAYNCQRLGFKTPCAVDGKCHDCKSPQRGCCTAVTLEYSRIPNRITVIIVGENLGL